MKNNELIRVDDGTTRCGRAVLLQRRTRGSASLPMDFMHAALARRVFQLGRQSRAHRILLNIKPLLGNSPHPAAGDESRRVEMRRIGTSFCQTILPETNPTLDGEFQIIRSAKQMQVIGHQQVITDEPGGGRVFPNVMDSVLHRCLGEPALAPFRAETVRENPIRSAEENMNAFGRCVARGSSLFTAKAWLPDDFDASQNLVGRCCRTAGRAAARPYQFADARQRGPTENEKTPRGSAGAGFARERNQPDAPQRVPTLFPLTTEQGQGQAAQARQRHCRRFGHRQNKRNHARLTFPLTPESPARRKRDSRCAHSDCRVLRRIRIIKPAKG